MGLPNRQMNESSDDGGKEWVQWSTGTKVLHSISQGKLLLELEDSKYQKLQT